MLFLNTSRPEAVCLSGHLFNVGMLHLCLISVNADMNLLITLVQSGNTASGKRVGGESDVDAAVPLGFCRWHCIVS